MSWPMEIATWMDGGMLLAGPCFPLLLLAIGLLSGRRPVMGSLPLAALPALAAALMLSPGADLGLPWLLLGSRLQLAGEARIFLLFSALLWLFGGLYAQGYLAKDPRRQSFQGFFLAAMSGNFGLLVASDMLSFFLFFALMSFSSYGLVVHNRDSEALRAGRIYLYLVLLGEVLLFSALLLIAQAAGSLDLGQARAAVASSANRDLILGLLLAGFGIKAGLIPLHIWLPLAHPAAPTPASAVLSGAMIKTGVFGLMRFLPLGLVALPGWALALTVAGLVMAFFGVLIGLTQVHPKIILAYSSISQMGFLVAALGFALASPRSWPELSAVLALYALHHGLAKGSLFLGVGMAPAASRPGGHRFLVALGLLLPALALAGAPLTSGALAKAALKTQAESATLLWPGWASTLLALAAVGTTLLMIHFLFQLWPRSAPKHFPAASMWVAWGTLLLATTVLAWLLAEGSAQHKTLSVAGLWSSSWPMGLGLLLAAAAGKRWQYGRPLLPWRVPPGDLLSSLDFCGRWLGRRWQAWRQSLGGRSLPRWPRLSIPSPWPLLASLEGCLGRWPVAGALFLLLLLAQVYCLGAR